MKPSTMPSGFLILADGRCLARRWLAYDQVIRAVAESMDDSAEGLAMRDWLLSLLPGPEDEEEIGIGAWHRSTDDQTIVRHLDIRELTPQNQRRFHTAVSEAVKRCVELPEAFDWLDLGRESLMDLGDMVIRGGRGEAPLSRSDWREVVPSEGRHVGPGW
jgi:hypothetical protein